MINRFLKDKVVITLLVVLFLAAFFEIFTYFFYIYKPASQIFGNGHRYPLEIPALSQLLAPPQITDASISIADNPKKIYPERILSFKTLLDNKLQNENTFLKSSSMDYILAGTVKKNELQTSDGSVVITLTNSTNSQVIEKFGADELRTIPVSLIIVSPTQPSRADSLITEAKEGDYLIIKTSTLLFQKGLDTHTEIEIFRSAK